MFSESMLPKTIRIDMLLCSIIFYSLDVMLHMIWVYVLDIV